MVLLVAPVMAADWRVVVNGTAAGGERVGVDRARIERDGDKATAWSRIELGRNVADVAGAYNAIEALNTYDCERRQFTTQRRVYFNGTEPVREEAAARQKANTVQVGSIDERLFNEACRPERPQDAVRLAQAAAVAARGVEAQRPQAMHADMRTLGASETAQVMRVADTAEKPRMIELPKIDKEAAAREAAAAGVAASKTAAEHGMPPKAEPKPAAVPAHAAPAATAPKALPPVAKPATPIKPVVAEPAVGGHARELMLATSGPSKARRKDAKETNPAQEMHVHWGYDGAGAPANWGKLKPDYATCDNGKRQSPIDIRPGIAVDLDPIKFAYKQTKYRVFDNGHTIQVNVGAGSTIEVMGKRYELVQFHFHKPSEERINGRPYPMVAHFVHKDWDDNLAVIAVLLDEGPEHPALQQVWNNLPLEANSEVLAGDTLDLNRLLPDNRAYWTYMGSLTTPPCSENVLWMVMKTPVMISAEQVAIFGRLYKNNARPVQPSNGRLIKESR
jgi:carbonic anhydrase